MAYDGGHATAAGCSATAAATPAPPLPPPDESSADETPF